VGNRKQVHDFSPTGAGMREQTPRTLTCHWNSFSNFLPFGLFYSNFIVGGYRRPVRHGTRQNPVVTAQAKYEAVANVFFSLCTATLLICSPSPEDTPAAKLRREALNKTDPCPVQHSVIDELTGG
jgi:hypothetical protein